MRRLGPAPGPVGVGDLPEGLGIGRIGDVEGPVVIDGPGDVPAAEDAADARALAGDEDRSPGPVDLDVGDGGGAVAIDVVGVEARVVGRVDRVHVPELGQEVVGDEAPELFARGGVEAVEHAVVGPDVDDLRPRGLGRLELGVARRPCRWRPPTGGRRRPASSG